MHCLLCPFVVISKKKRKVEDDDDEEEEEEEEEDDADILEKVMFPEEMVPPLEVGT